MKLPSPFIKDSENINVIVETPKGSRNKFTYEPESGLYKLSKIFPAGMVFPFEFGFIPNTTAEDGDPTDALVMMDEPSYPGCLVEARVVGVLEAEQLEDGKKVRNDRIIAVALGSQTYSSIHSLGDINKDVLEDVKDFFINYHKRSKDEFIPLADEGPSRAIELIKKTINHGNS